MVEWWVRFDHRTLVMYIHVYTPTLGTLHFLHCLPPPLLASYPPSPKVEELELALDTRRQLSEGRSLEPISETEKEALRRDICEQENLLQGYQKVREQCDSFGGGTRTLYMVYMCVHVHATTC